METTKHYGIRKGTLLWLGIFAAILILQSCDKEPDEMTMISEEEEIEMVENSTETENMADEDLSIVYAVEAEANTQGRAASICAQTTWNEELNMLTIDFGEGCIGPYGRERSGKIIITYDGELGLYTTDKVITFEDYVVNNVGVSGRILLNAFEENSEGYIENTYTLEAYTLTFPDGNTFTMGGTRTREWIEGIADADPLNNVFRLTGAVSGSSTRGRSFTHTIVDPIIVDFGCHASGGFLRVSGVKEFIAEGIRRDRVREVHYGDGTCDNSYVVIINGQSYTITKE
jgi:hypothetical protein